MALINSFKLMNTRTLEQTKVFKDLEKKLKEPKWYKPMLDYTEESLKLNRVYVVLGCSFILISTLIFNYGFQLLCAAVGFLYPAYETILSLENPNSQDTRKWLTYWLVLCAFNFAEILLFFLYWIPGYVLFKCAFFVWCYNPATSGSDIIYKSLICPLFRENQHVIDNTINRFMVTAQHTMNANRDPNSDGEIVENYRD